MKTETINIIISYDKKEILDLKKLVSDLIKSNISILRNNLILYLYANFLLNEEIRIKDSLIKKVADIDDFNTARIIKGLVDLGFISRTDTEEEYYLLNPKYFK